ncbi:uncharacterized protein LOC117104236 isoform X2 [Anneissia japonica]|uniref:uncharacterized protein LOC117104236 isoform X2 n=1 Tax=Anneissia japonica TaxID=1529436 RepID=UPI0014255F67|nr:uncharacterized protein LOC117104236 isoform X2 [Anneissia japonica]
MTLYNTEAKHCVHHWKIYSVCLINLFLHFGILAQSGSVTVDPATAKLGENATMTFTFTPSPGKALLYVSWFKSNADGVQGDSIINNILGNPQPNDRYSLNSNGYLIISDVMKADTDYYLCKLTVSDGSNADGLSTLTVYYLETPTLEPTNIYVNETEKNAMFTCPFPDGVPTPIDILWIKDDSVLCVSNTEKYPQSDTTLEISKVNEMDEGDYQCRAENAAYNGNEGKLSNKGTLSLFRPTSPSTTSIASIASSFSIVPSLTSVASISTTVPQKYTSSNTNLLVGLTFLSFLLRVLLSSIIFVVLGKMRNSKPQVTNAISRHYEEPAVTGATPGHYEQPANLLINFNKIKYRLYFISKVSEAAPRNEKHPSAYTAYIVEPEADNKYEDLQWNNDNPVVYVNVK